MRPPYGVDESSLIFFLDNADKVCRLEETKGKKWKTLFASIFRPIAAVVT